MPDQQPPAPGWWQGSDGGWRPPTESRPESSPAENTQPTDKPALDLSPEAVASRAKAQDSKNASIGCMTLLLICAIIWAIAALAGGDDDEDAGSSSGGGGSASAEDLKFGAFDVCTQFVKDRLNAPATASFRNYFEDDGEVTVTGGPTVFTVISSVDSENSFGANVRSQFICEVSHVTGDQWRLVDIQIT